MTTKNLFEAPHDVYIASSWKNVEKVRELADRLRALNISVYDFSDQRCRNIDQGAGAVEPFDPERESYEAHLRASPQFLRTVQENRSALHQCQICVLILPCGNDAHADWGYAVGAQKRTCIVGHPNKGDRTSTHLWASQFMDTLAGAAAWAENEMERLAT